VRRYLLAGLVLAAAAGPLASIATGKPVVAGAAWAESLPRLMTYLAGGLAVWAMGFQVGPGVLPRWRKKVLGFDRFWPRPFFTVPRVVVSLLGFTAVLVTVVPTILLQCGAILLLPVYYAGLRAVRRPGSARTLRTARDCGLVAFAALAFFPGAVSLAGAVATTLLLAALLPRLMEDLDGPRRSAEPAPSPAGRRTRTLWAMPAVAALAALLFVGFPRFAETPPEDSGAGPARRERKDPGTRPAPPGTGTVSVPRRVSIGDIGRLQQDMRPFLEVTVLRGGRPADAEDLGALFRSGALEEFDGITWESPAAAARLLRDAGDGARDGVVTLPPRRLPPGERVEQKVRYLVEGYDPLFCLGMPVSVGGDGAKGGVLLVGRGEARAPSPFPEGTAITIRSVVAKGEYAVVDAEPPDEEHLAALVEVPPGHDRVAAFARGEFGGPAPPTGTALLRRMERFLARRCRYSLEIAPTGGASPVDAFLFQSRRGHCELFASSAAVMLRSLGVPARVVIGFRGGVLDPATKRYVFRGADAHAWVEAWFDGQGWRSFDPTPPAPAEEKEAAAAPPAEGDGDEGPSRSLAERILAFDAAAQRRLVLDVVNLAASTARNTFLDGAGRPRWMVFATLAAAVALLGVALLRGPRVAAPAAPPGPVRASPAPSPEAWRILVDRLAAAGVRRAPSETGLELAHRAEASGIGPGEAIRRLAAAYAAERFGERAPSPEERAALLALAGTVGRPSAVPGPGA
jgi:transglutaminase-like putative cysteine protease